MVRTNQGGSVLSFVMIGAVMVCLFIGGAYIVHQQTTQPSGAAQPAQTPAKQPETKPLEGSDTPNKTTPEATSPATTDQPNTSQEANPSVEVSQLPHTGPASMLGSLLVIGLLSGVAVSYVRSRHPQLTL